MCLEVFVRELLEIIEIVFYQNGLVVELNQEIIKHLKIKAQPNYFQYKYAQYIQEEVLALGVPTPSIFTEIYLKYPENTKIFNILTKHHVVVYVRYV